MESQYKYFMFHKPAGFITAKKDARHPVVMDFFAHLKEEGLHPVGRLDKDTEGLLFITNDGQWNQKIMHPLCHITKKYYFIALGYLDDEKTKKLEEGVMMQEIKARPAYISNMNETLLKEVVNLLDGKQYEKTKKNLMDSKVVMGEIRITEGKKHQVKRMLRAVGCKVFYLKRLSIGSVSLDEGLEIGEYRELTDAEVKNVLR